MIATSRSVGVFMDTLVFGAAPTIAKEEVRNLRIQGLNASLLLIKRGIATVGDELGDLSPEVMEDQSTILSKANLRIPGFSFFSSFHLLAPLLSAKFNVKYDFLVAHGTYTCFTAQALRARKGIRYAAYIYDPISYILPHVYSRASLRYALPLLNTIGRKMDTRVMNASETVILLSKYHLQAVEQMTDKPIRIVYPGTKVAPSIPDRRGDYILAVARWEPGKKPFFLLDILNELRRRGTRAKLVLAGAWKSERLRNDFLRKVKRDRLDDVLLTGPLERAELSRLYSGARVLVVPDITAFGMIALEAAGHGAPIIIPKGSGVTDLFQSGVQGFFPNEGDLHGFSSFLSRLLCDERLAYRMGYRGWETAQNYTWGDHAKTLASAIEDFF